MPKSLRTEQIADLFLAHLAHLEEADRNNNLLVNFLVSRGIYHDFNKASAVIQLLLDEGLVAILPNYSSIIDYNPIDYDVGKSKVLSVTVMGFGYTRPDTIPACAITGKGRHFVAFGQQLDSQAIAEKVESRKKWNERLINFLIALITAVGVVLLTEPIKKRINSVPHNETSNASSPVRPRLDPRQRPEPREPVGAAAPGGRAGR